MLQEDNHTSEDILAHNGKHVGSQDGAQKEDEGDVKDFFRRRVRKIADDKTEENTLDPTFEVVPETRARRLKRKQVGSKERSESVGQAIADDEPILMQTRQAKKKSK